jgi:hypothetical protein
MAETGQTAGESGGAQEKAQQAAEQAREQAQRAAGQARDRMREQVDQRSTQAGEQLSSQAGDLRTLGEELRNQGKEGPAKLADRVAEHTERAGSWLRDSDADRILSDVEDFGRRKPWAIAAGGMVIGFAASRFLKASSSSRYQQRGGIADASAGRATGYGGPAPTYDSGQERFDRASEVGTGAVGPADPYAPLAPTGTTAAVPTASIEGQP